MTEDPIVRIADIRNALGTQACSLGIRRWFLTNEIDFRKFLDEGMPLSYLQQKVGDGYVEQVAKYMKGKHHGRR